MRWVVVGSSGYIGSALCQYLVEAGEPVLSISRRPQAPKGCDHLQLLPFSVQGFAQVFRPGDRVVYAAGLSSSAECRRDPELAQWLNAELPVQLLGLANQAGVESFLYLSSVKARVASSAVIARESCGKPAADRYGGSKWLAEQGLLSQEVGCRLNILRPAAVYGGLPADAAGNALKNSRVQVLRNLVQYFGRWLPLVPVTGYRSVVSLPDLLQAVVLIEQQGCDREVLIAAEAGFYDAATLMEVAAGRPVRRSRWLSALLFCPFRWLHALGSKANAGGLAARVLELERSELYSAATLRARVNWRAKSCYRDFLRGR